MPLPPAPPPDRRFMCFLTEEGERAVRARSGPLYELMIRGLLEENPECFSSRREVEEVLPLFLWPPSPPENLCLDFPHVPTFPTGYRVNGRHVQVVITNASTYLNMLYLRTSIKAAFIEQWGFDGLIHAREQFISEGDSAEQFEQMIHEKVRQMEDQSQPPASDEPE